jgi:hypothetical protein
MINNMPICKALLKHGRSSFMLEILESHLSPLPRRKGYKCKIYYIFWCEPEIRFKREAYYLYLYLYLKWLKPKYNIILDVTPFTAEAILKMSKDHPRSEMIIVRDLSLNTKIVYHSIRHAATSLGFNRTSIAKPLNYFK